MVDNIFQIENTFLLAGPDGLFDRVEDHRGGHRRCDPPAQNPPGVGIDHQRHVDTHVRSYADVRIMPMRPQECLLMKRFTLEMSA